MFDTNELRLLYWNADGVRKKLTELADLAVGDLSSDIIAISETILSPQVPIHLPGYCCYRQDKLGSRGQGVAIFVRVDIPHTQVITPQTEHMEAIGIQMSFSGQTLVIFSIYQSPNLDLKKSDIDALLNCGRHVLLVGDFNARHPHWCKHSIMNPRGKTLYNHMVCNEYNIHAPSSPTLVHYINEHRPSTPDLVVASNIYSISSITAMAALSSNHLPVYLKLTGTIRREAINVFNYKQADWSKFRSHLNNHVSLTSKVFDSVELIDREVQSLTSALVMARDSSVPKANSNQNGHRLPKFIKKLIRSKNSLRFRELKATDPITRKDFRSQINILQARIKSVVKFHNDNVWKDKLSRADNSFADLWQIVRSLKGKSVTIPPLLKPDGGVTSTVSEQCNELASAFNKNMSLTLQWFDEDTNNSVNASMNNLNSCNNNTTSSSLASPREVLRHIRSLKSRKAPGNDEIHNMLLKNMPQKCLVLFTKIINSCLIISYFPSVWKTAKVISLPKPGKNHNQAVNYRPISLLSTLGKIFERIVYDRILTSFDHRLINEQFGFRRFHSTIQQLARVSEHVSHNLNMKQSTGMLLLDIEKAFDTVWHEGLLHKLFINDVPICLVKLIQSYLFERKFKVFINSTSSDPYDMPAGVPQGSVLGPLLFLIYINDIPKQPRTYLACFADDTASYSSSSDEDLIISRLQFSLNLLADYFNKWKLKLNETKTEAIMFSRKRKPPDRKLTLKNHQIPWNKSVKYLGVYLDNKLNWTSHVDYSRSKGLKAYGALSPIMNRKSNLSPKIKIKIYSSLIRPCLTYAAPVWSSTCLSNYSKLQVLQNKAFKIAYNTPFYTNITNLHVKCSFPLIKEFIFQLTKTFYLLRNKKNKNQLISSLGKTRLSNLTYVDTYNRYRLPHHYVLDDINEPTTSKVVTTIEHV